MCILCLFLPKATKPIQKEKLKLLLFYYCKKAIAWKKMPEWCFEFLEGPITETQPMELRQLASGAQTWRQTGERGERRERSTEEMRMRNQKKGEGLKRVLGEKEKMETETDGVGGY